MKTFKYYIIALFVFTTQLAAKAQTTTDPVFSAYLGIKNALVADNNQEAQLKAKAMLTALAAIPADQKQAWKPFADKLQFDSRHISESADLDHQREHFASLSKNMAEAVKALKLNNDPVYEQYCPMKKTTWLSESNTIKNPYYGKQMLTCGKTTATLPAAK